MTAILLSCVRLLRNRRPVPENCRRYAGSTTAASLCELRTSTNRRELRRRQMIVDTERYLSNPRSRSWPRRVSEPMSAVA